ncbi:Maf family protein [Spirochaeta lutea]|uniref:Maf family protein n=1 Tax=Spirochaeta lutea TaxID=1480694 RepID=UPI000563A26A|nr:Maf family protein [Spirochaeta lutea]
MKQIMPFVLGSASPQRHHLVEQLGLTFRVVVSHADETMDSQASPERLVQDLAQEKQRCILAEAEVDTNRELLLTADTLVFVQGRALGKPESADEAHAYLSMLSHRCHEVLTGVAMKGPGVDRLFSVTTKVFFSALSPGDIHWYLEQGEWKGAAGGYRIQGSGSAFISHIEGSHTNVVGLPLREIYGILRSINFWK